MEEEEVRVVGVGLEGTGGYTVAGDPLTGACHRHESVVLPAVLRELERVCHGLAPAAYGILAKTRDV